MNGLKNIYDVLGLRRIAVLLSLLVVNALFAAVLYGYILPEKINQERALRSARGQVASLQSDIDRLQIEFDQLEDQKVRFADLETSGFFYGQGRRRAEMLLTDIQKSSGVLSAVASVKPGVFEKSVYAEKAGYKILSSPIEINIEAMDDLNIYRYLYILERVFPGQVLIDKMTITRDLDVTGTLLRRITSGEKPPIIKADLLLSWRTMIPDEENEDEQ